MNDPLTELDRMHFRHRPFTMRADIVQCSTCLISWPCDASVLVAAAQRRPYATGGAWNELAFRVVEAARRVADKRTLYDGGFWVSKREMRYLDDALAAFDESLPTADDVRGILSAEAQANLNEGPGASVCGNFAGGKRHCMRDAGHAGPHEHVVLAGGR